MEIGIFSNIGGFVERVLGGALSEQTNQLISFISTIFATVMILYLLIQGYLIITGRVENPLNNVFFKLTSMVLILVIATDVGGYLTFINQAIDGLKDLAISDGSNPYIELDKLLVDKLNIITSIWQAKKFPYFFDTVAIVSTLIGTLLLLIPIGMAILVNDITLKILLAFTPLFIFCLTFQFIRGMFNNWLQLCFANILYFVILAIILKMFMRLDSLIDFDHKNVMAYSAMMIILGFFAKEIVGIAKEISSGISSVSAEGIGTSIASSMGNSMKAMSYGAGKKVASFVGSGVVKTGMKVNPALAATMKAINKIK